MKYTTRVVWQKNPEQPFIDNRYSRLHKWVFDGGVELPASSSPQVVPTPFSDASAVDPEEAFVASISSCHMLFFLSLAATQKFVVERYEDRAEGVMSKNEEGKMAMTHVVLQPTIVFSAHSIPSAEQIEQLHKLAHEKCYIANSVKTDISIIPIK